MKRKALYLTLDGFLISGKKAETEKENESGNGKENANERGKENASGNGKENASGSENGRRIRRGTERKMKKMPTNAEN